MARIHIEVPEEFVFTTTIQVRAADLNYGNHVGHDSILTLFQEARIIYYRSLGFQNELSFEGTIGQVISDAAVVYKSEAFLGDVLTCKIAAADFTKYGFDLLYLPVNENSGKEVARGKTGIVCFDYATRKIAQVPSVVLERMSS